MALGALAMQINDYGHTTVCWKDRNHFQERAPHCLSEACDFARKALGLDHLDDNQNNTVRDILARHIDDARRWASS